MSAQQKYRVCRVCGCDDLHACVGEDGPCHWPDPKDDICSACWTAKEHVIHMNDFELSEDAGRTTKVTRADCDCGWFCIMPRGSVTGGELYAAIRGHWQGVVARAGEEAA